ncbi:hypothetical protein BpHYR1_023396 [Brachionus plicatilis]|uniref:Uncharacterized protein n=1 Tax=Brachionus plicatilis TaxID=10195 RepID=A0A3M7QAY0_BRAPC|nr:hypothetical protein BpHYR1_023396 [Brachionus plicatilis]
MSINQSKTDQRFDAESHLSTQKHYMNAACRKYHIHCHQILVAWKYHLEMLKSLQLARQVPQRQTESLQQDYLRSFQMIHVNKCQLIYLKSVVLINLG